ncbi:DNA repair protein RadC [Gluconacetobacter entanii]|uniref:DNA repair protein RadC n=1 Tax=Gluconacetobacter entanii TaxID=108528 RepID=A0ABT3K9E9_9PROT|nr:JAB domain-containing protein [Gluconacetobacter entanii]MCW4592028.1 DNA repair protein RadC [Gluconacetobacter entanii]MCW4595227.1 DNA repair protein RadC [Gluconacetobacter entanii]
MASRAVSGRTGPGGHRARMRARIRAAGGASLADYEILEVLLFAGIPRRDTKPLAKDLIARFGSLSAVLSAGHDALRAAGVGPRACAVLGLPAMVAGRLCRGDARPQPYIHDLHAAWSHYATTRAALPARGRPAAGRVTLLLLNATNRLVGEERVPDGPPADMCRDILQRVLRLHAVSIVVVWDDGTFPPTPRQMEGAATVMRQVEAHGRLLSTVMHDCIIAGEEGWTSLRREKML